MPVVRTLTRRLLIASAVTGAAVLAAATPALAVSSVSWGPLASYYKNQQRSYSSGTFFDDRATYATVKVYLNDPSNDGNNAYTDADEYFYEPDLIDCGADSAGHPLTCWAFDRKKQSAEYSYSNTPVTFYLYNSLHAKGDRARAAIHTCAQMGWPVPDQCSPDAIATIDY
jgi:hypothetical protein